MTLAQLAAKKRKKVPPQYWRVLDAPTVSSRWNGRIGKFVEKSRDMERLEVTIEWVNGEVETFERGREIIPATFLDRLAYLSKLAEWERIKGAREEFERVRNWENQFITRGELVETLIKGSSKCARETLVGDEVEVWADGAQIAEANEDYDESQGYVMAEIICTPFGWEKQKVETWWKACVVAPPKNIGEPFEVAIRDGSGEDGRVVFVHWFDVRRLAPTPPPEAEGE